MARYKGGKPRRTYRPSRHKFGINGLAAKHFVVHRNVHFKDVRVRALILDHEKCVTSKVLNKNGFAFKDIFAPNINTTAVANLNRLGVNSQFNTMERFLEKTRIRTKIPYFWYDGMCTLPGNQDGHQPCVAMDTYLRRNLGGDNCIVGVTICARCSTKGAKYRPQIELLEEQMNAIFACNGFAAKELELFSYNQDTDNGIMIFGLWELTKDPSVEPKKLLRLKRRRQFLGFPKDYDFDRFSKKKT
jgi:hypothetical protein